MMIFSKRVHGLTILMSIALSLSLSFLVYVYYLQPFGLSTKRILAGGLVIIFLSLIFLPITRSILKTYFVDDNARFLKTIGFWIFMALLLSPHFLPLPHYPVSPLFERTSNIRIIFHFLNETPEPVQLRGVWLDFDDKKYSFSSFRYSDEWVKSSDRYFLDSGSQGELYWEGKIGERAKLTIFPMETSAHITVIWDGEESSSDLTDASVVFRKKSTASAWYYFLITVARINCAGYLLFILFTIFLGIKDSKRQLAVAGFSLLLIGLMTVYYQYQIAEEVREDFDLQVNYNQAVISGRAPNPYQYRVFSEWLIVGLARISDSLGIVQSYYFVFALVRVAQSLLTTFLLFIYYRKLGFSILLSLTGIVFATGSMFNSFLHHGFSINTYFDVIFYLVAALLVLNQSFVWLPPLMVIASFNRETSGLIPFLGLSGIPDLQKGRAKITPVLLALFAWGLVFIFLHLVYPAHEMFISYGYSPGLPLLGYNLSPSLFHLLFRFFGLVPLLGLAVFRIWPQSLKRFFVALIPIWFLIHLFASVITETRLFLVPQFLVFLPSFLVFIQYLWDKTFSENGSAQK